MISFVIFKVLDRLYGIDIECVKRILPAQFLTEMPDEGKHIEGMFQYEDEIIKVLSFRTVIGEQSYEEELALLFPELKAQHKSWLDALKESVEKGSDFTKTTNPHHCHLGKWIDSLQPDDKDVMSAMKALDFHHQQLHRSAVDVLEQRDSDPEMAMKWIDDNVQGIYEKTQEHIDEIAKMSSKLAATLQRCLILFGEDNSSFGMNIDSVVDIIHIEESKVHRSEGVQSMGDFMNVSGILEYEGKLITVVKNISLTKRSA